MIEFDVNNTLLPCPFDVIILMSHSYETTANSLVWTLWTLEKHPTVQGKSREEIIGAHTHAESDLDERSLAVIKTPSCQTIWKECYYHHFHAGDTFGISLQYMLVSSSLSKVIEYLLQCRSIQRTAELEPEYQSVLMQTTSGLSHHNIPGKEIIIWNPCKLVKPVTVWGLH